MKWILWTAAVLAVGIAAVGGKKLLEKRDDSPRAVLRSVEERTQLPGFDERTALRDLERALGRAIEIGDREVGGELLALHADILRELGSLSLAREDLERIVSDFRPDNLEIELQIADLLWQEGRPEAALDLVTTLQDRDPEFAPGWTLKGKLEQELAATRLEEAKESARVAHIEEVALEVAEVLDELTARDVDDPARAILTHQLRDLYLPNHEAQLEPALNLVDIASRHNTAARRAYARCIGSAASPDAMAPLLQIFVAAGRPETAVDLGMASMSLPEVASDSDTVRVLVELLGSMGRYSEVKGLLQEWGWEEFPADSPFYEAATLALYKAGSWTGMSMPVSRMRRVGSTRMDRIATYYLGMMNLNRERYDRAINSLDRFTDRPEEPFPGATARAWLGLAESYRKLDRGREREALEAYVALEPGGRGSMWLRLAELQLKAQNSGFRIPEERWTKGMNLLPHRAYDLTERWAEIGAQSLRADALSLQGLTQRMLNQSLSVPATSVGPWALYRLGEIHLEQDRPHSALLVSRELRRDYPDLIPALDLGIRAQVARGLDREAAILLLRRLELVGRNEQTIELMSLIPEGTFTQAQVLQAMRSDPLHTGRLVVARALLERGDFEGALRAARISTAEDSESRLIAARALVGLKREKQALQWIEGLENDPLFGQEARTIQVQALIAQDFPEQLDELVESIILEPNPDPGALHELARVFLKKGDAELAHRLYQRLDEDPESRGGELSMQLALTSELARDREMALVYLERAEAFVPDGEPEFARMLFAIKDRDWPALPDLVAALRATAFEPTPLQEAILTLFEERVSTARHMAEAGLGREPYDADWALMRAACQSLLGEPVDLPEYFGSGYVDETVAILRGRDDEVRDPRDVLGLMLAMEFDDWILWTVPQVFRLNPDSTGTLWPAWLGAQALLKLDQAESASTQLTLLVTSFRRFGPAWDTSIALALEDAGGDRYNTDVVALRTRRTRALGAKLSGSTLEAEIDRAAERFAEESFRATRHILLDAYEEDRSETPPIAGRDLLGRTHLRLGEIDKAITELARACEALPEGSDHPLVAELVDTIENGRGQGEKVPNPDIVRPILKRLTELFPSDPLVPLALARFTANTTSNNPSLQIGQAFGLLERFNASVEYIPLDELRPGATIAWVDFLLPLDAERAEELIHSELSAKPGEIELWMLLASAYEAQDRTDEALALYDDIISFASLAEAHAHAAWLLTLHGGTLREIERHLRFVENENKGRPSIRAAYTRLRSQLQLSTPPLDELIGSLGQMWERRETIDHILPPFDVGSTYSYALLLRHMKPDLRHARVVTGELLAYAPDEYAVDALRCLGGLAEQITAAKPGEGEDRVPQRRGAEKGGKKKKPKKAKKKKPGAGAKKPEKAAQGNDGG